VYRLHNSGVVCCCEVEYHLHNSGVVCCGEVEYHLHNSGVVCCGEVEYHLHNSGVVSCREVDAVDLSNEDGRHSHEEGRPVHVHCCADGQHELRYPATRVLQ
jgi:hypothetical protein